MALLTELKSHEAFEFGILGFVDNASRMRDQVIEFFTECKMVFPIMAPIPSFLKKEHSADQNEAALPGGSF